MPTEEENVQYLYQVLTNGGPPQIDMAAVAKTLDLSLGTASKRWSRLKQAMEQDKDPSAGSYSFLWLCVKHSNRDQTPDWNAIAKACGTTSGAASKRYSRMKLAFEKGKVGPATPRKPKAAKDASTPATGSKRKRVPAVTSAGRKVNRDDDKYKPDPEKDDDNDGFTPTKLKRTKAGTGPKPRAAASSCKPKAGAVKDKGKPVDTGANVVVGKQGDLNVPTPTFSHSVNPTEATTLFKSSDATLNGGGASAHLQARATDKDELVEQFYDAAEDAEEAAAHERVENWLEETEEQVKMEGVEEI